MRRGPVLSIAAALLLMILVSACGSAPSASVPTASAPIVSAPTASAPIVRAPTANTSAEKNFEDFDPNNFDRSTQIDNERQS